MSKHKRDPEIVCVQSILMKDRLLRQQEREIQKLKSDISDLNRELYLQIGLQKDIEKKLYASVKQNKILSKSESCLKKQLEISQDTFVEPALFEYQSFLNQTRFELSDFIEDFTQIE